MLLTYRNPVWHGELADPFVLRWQGVYYAYGTSGAVSSPSHDDRVFPVLNSSDLVHWEYLGRALEPAGHLPGSVYWAPEVAEHNGRFYMYYSAAESPGDESHRLHVATAEDPTGPFRTAGSLLPGEDFTIDAHPFRDPHNGQWYLFFARDFFDERVGTGIAAVPLSDTMIHTSGPVTTILRASFDWQVFERNRRLYGRLWDAWHTVEGPCVVRRNPLYYCFYSGGAWHSEDYGVSYGVSQNVLGPYRDEWSRSGPSVLRSVPNKVFGPGHNSIVIGPDNRTDFIVYHAWGEDKTARRMCIDPLRWTPEGPDCPGPTTDEQTIEV